MEKNFRVSSDGMKQLLDCLRNVQDDVDSAYSKMTKLISQIQTDEAWAGQSQKEWLAYMDLMNQFHSSFTDMKSKNPIASAKETLNKYINELNEFYDFREFIDMEELP